MDWLDEVPSEFQERYELELEKRQTGTHEFLQDTAAISQNEHDRETMVRRVLKAQGRLHDPGADMEARARQERKICEEKHGDEELRLEREFMEAAVAGQRLCFQTKSILVPSRAASDTVFSDTMPPTSDS